MQPPVLTWPASSTFEQNRSETLQDEVAQLKEKLRYHTPYPPTGSLPIPDPLTHQLRNSPYCPWFCLSSYAFAAKCPVPRQEYFCTVGRIKGNETQTLLAEHSAKAETVKRMQSGTLASSALVCYASAMRYPVSDVACYEMSSTEEGSTGTSPLALRHGIVLRPSYGMSGTEIGYGGTRRRSVRRRRRLPSSLRS
eukprot:2510280-Rhodomonas_salina.1